MVPLQVMKKFNVTKARIGQTELTLHCISCGFFMEEQEFCLQPR